MLLFNRINKTINSLSLVMNWISAASLTLMMLLTCADVILRFFRYPIPGAYEMVGFLGALVVSFSLAKTSIERGHIAVDFLVSKLSKKMQGHIDRLNSIICAALFGCITWQSVIYALNSKKAGEVSMTLQMPVYPFIFGVAMGCGVLCIILVLRVLSTFTNEHAA